MNDRSVKLKQDLNLKEPPRTSKHQVNNSNSVGPTQCVAHDTVRGVLGGSSFNFSEGVELLVLQIP